MDLAGWLTARTRLHPGEDESEPNVVGWAWATVDLQRALGETGIERGRWVAVDDALLGARGLQLRGVVPALLLLEPATEGRLAAWLARHGEGEVAVYRLRMPGGDATRGARTALGSVGTLAREAEPPGTPSTPAARARRLVVELLTAPP